MTVRVEKRSQVQRQKMIRGVWWWGPRLCAVVATLVFGGAAAAEAEEVRHDGLTVRVSPDRATGRCVFELSSRVAARKIEHFPLEGPPRLVVDLQGVAVSRGREVELRSSSCAVRVRFGVQRQATRVVFDLPGALQPEYHVAISGGGFWASGIVTAGAGVPLAGQLPSGQGEASAPLEPTPAPSPIATSPPSPMPSPSLTPTPQHTPTPLPTATSTAVPTSTPTLIPTAMPTPSPTAEVSSPTVSPTPIEVVDGGGREATPAKPLSGEQTVAPSALGELSFNVDRVLVDFRSDARPVQNILVTNTSPRAISISAQVREVESPGQVGEKLKETRAVLVSPMNLNLEAGASRQVRIVGVEEPGDTEQVFKLALTPFSGSPRSSEQGSTTGAPGEFKAAPSFEVLILRAPEDAAASLVWKRSGGDVVLSNEGSRSIALTELRVCRGAGTAECVDSPSRRLYPGTSWSTMVPIDGRLEVLKRVGNDFETIVIEGAAS
jgi:P pilus assembly chaperone PapD